MPRKTQLFAIDAGNWGIKFKSQDTEGSFRHAVRPLTETEWRAYLQRVESGNPYMLRVNGQPFAFGVKAVRMGSTDVRKGAERYEREYYGVIMAAALWQAYERNMRNLLIYSTHAPRDLDYRPDIRASVLGDWRVDDGFSDERLYSVNDGRQIDEPVAGLRERLLTETGRYRKNNGLTQPSPDVPEPMQITVDIGGETTDLVIAYNGKPDYTDLTTIRTVDAGIYDAKEVFWQAVQQRYRTTLKKGARKWDEERIHRAMRTGKLDAGGLGVLDVEIEAREALNELLDNIITALNGMNAMIAHDILLTGGGGAVVFDRLREVYRHPNIQFVSDDLDNAHMANVRGAWKTLMYLRGSKVI